MRRTIPATMSAMLALSVGACGQDSGSATDGGPTNDGGMGVDGGADAGGDRNVGDAKSDADAAGDGGGRDGSATDSSGGGDGPNAGDSGAGGDSSTGTDSGGGVDASGDAMPCAQSYTTSFPLTEDPISEMGNWINGGMTGLDWGDVQTTPGLAFGTVVSGGPPYNDSTAVLSGTWCSDQTAQATVHIASPNSNIFEEVELRLRTTVTAHSITGYEFNFRCTSDGSQYVQIVRWNGALNDFTYVSSTTGPGLHDGDIIKATAVGSTLTSYINGVQQVQGTDSTYPGGSPGVGFYNQGGTANDNSTYGFTAYTAMAQ